MKEINLDEILLSTLKSLRGSRSLMKMSEELGYTYNQYAKWESGRKVFFWEDFFKICQVQNINITSSIAQFYNCTLSTDKNSGIALLFFFLDHHFNGNKKSICSFLQVDQQKFTRWSSNENNIPFQVPLKLFSLSPQIFLAFLNDLKILQFSPSLNTEFSTLSSAITTDASVPWASLVQYFIGTESYGILEKNDLDFIGKKLNLSRDQVEKAIQVSLKSNLLEYNSSGKLCKNLETLETTKFLSNEEAVHVLEYLHYRSLSSITSRAKKKHQDPKENNITGHRVFHCSSEASEKISKELKTSFFNILNILENDDAPQEGVRVLLFNHFGLYEEEPPELDSHLGFYPSD